jgi:hypothetical protein
MQILALLIKDIVCNSIEYQPRLGSRLNVTLKGSDAVFQPGFNLNFSIVYELLMKRLDLKDYSSLVKS